MITKIIKLFKKPLSNDKGFTLLEILVASTVSTIILLMVYSAHRSIMFSIKDMAGIAEFYENVNLVVRRMDLDLSSMLVNRDNDKLFLIADNSMAPPYKGEIHFVTIMKSGLFINGNYKEPSFTSDIKEVSYYLKPDPDFPDLFFLVRREAKQYDEEKTKGGRDSIMLENVSDMRIELSAHSTTNWESSWDTDKTKRYPVAVKVTLNVKNYRAQEETFSFVSFINQR